MSSHVKQCQRNAVYCTAAAHLKYYIVNTNHV